MIITKKKYNNLLSKIADLEVDNAVLEGNINYLNNQIDIMKIERKALKDKIKELKKTSQDFVIDEKPKKKVGRPKKENK